MATWQRWFRRRAGPRVFATEADHRQYARANLDGRLAVEHWGTTRWWRTWEAHVWQRFNFIGTKGAKDWRAGFNCSHEVQARGERLKGFNFFKKEPPAFALSFFTEIFNSF